jgi:hypothetical protein
MIKIKSPVTEGFCVLVKLFINIKLNRPGQIGQESYDDDEEKTFCLA